MKFDQEHLFAAIVLCAPLLFFVVLGLFLFFLD